MLSEEVISILMFRGVFGKKKILDLARLIFRPKIFEKYVKILKMVEVVLELALAKRIISFAKNRQDNLGLAVDLAIWIGVQDLEETAFEMRRDRSSIHKIKI